MGAVAAARRAGALGAVDRDAFKVRGREGAVCSGFLSFRRTRAKNRVDVARDAFELDIGRGEAANVTAGAGERNPWRRSNLALLVDHLRLAVRAQSGPVQERALEADRAVRSEKAVAVGNRKAKAVAIEASQRRHDVLRGVRNERREMIPLTVPFSCRKLSKCGICSRSDGTFGLSRRK